VCAGCLISQTNLNPSNTKTGNAKLFHQDYWTFIRQSDVLFSCTGTVRVERNILRKK
jgi:hypothetical protein